MKRMKRNMREGGDEATEVYRLDGETPNEHLYFDVFSMRKWALANAEEVGVTLDWNRAERLITSGAVDPDRIKDHTIRNTMHPVIIGRDAAGPGQDQILDGAHRYVAAALGATAAGMAGVPIPLPAYVLRPDEWRPFLIPHFIAQALRFDVQYDKDDRRWPGTPRQSNHG